MGSFTLGTAAILAVLSLATLLIGLAGWLYPWTLVVLAGSAFIAWSCYLYYCLKAYPEDFQGLAAFPYLRWPVTLLFISTCGTILLAPPIFDELTYHLALPLRFFETHQIASIPYNVYSNFPLNIEMLYIFGEAVWGIYLPRFINLGLAGLIVLLMIAIARRHFTYEAGWLANLVFFSFFSVSTLLPFAYNDFGLALFSLAAFFCFLNWTEKEDIRWLIGAGLFSGAALGSKYLAGYGFIILCLLILAANILKKNGPKRSLTDLIAFSIPALVIFSPWLMKNWAMTGNPVYPFFFSDISVRYLTLLRGLYGPENLWGLPSFLLFNFKGDVPLGPTLLLILPLLSLLKRTDSKAKYLAVYALLFFLFWTMGSMVNRFLMPSLLSLSLLSGALIVQIKNRTLKVMLILILIVLAACNIWLSATMPKDMVFALLEYRELIALRTACNHLVAPDRKLLMAGEPRTYGFKCHTISPTMFDTNYTEVILRDNKELKEVVRILRSDGIEYVLCNTYRLRWLQENFGYFRDSKQLKRFISLVNSLYLKQVFKYGNLILFRPQIPSYSR